MKRILTAIVLSMSMVTAAAAGLGERALRTTLYGGIYINNEQAWQLEPSVSWQFHKYMAVAFGVEFTSQYNMPGRPAEIDGYRAELCDNQRNVAWFIFKPSVIFISPAVWSSSDGFFKLWFQAEPGVSLALPPHNSLTYELQALDGGFLIPVGYRRFPNKGLRWFYWHARLSVNFAIDRWIVGAGYALSDLDYYSARRDVTLPGGTKFHVPAKELSQSVFISLGYSF